MKNHVRVVAAAVLSIMTVLVLLSIYSTTIAQTETTPEENIAAVTNFYEEFSAGNVDVFLDVYADSVTRHAYGGSPLL
jgi:hypothetical protein